MKKLTLLVLSLLSMVVIAEEVKNIEITKDELDEIRLILEKNIEPSDISDNQLRILNKILKPDPESRFHGGEDGGS